jgi:hypothetical protein
VKSGTLPNTQATSEDNLKALPTCIMFAVKKISEDNIFGDHNCLLYAQKDPRHPTFLVASQIFFSFFFFQFC